MIILRRHCWFLVAIIGFVSFSIFALLLTKQFAPMIRLDAYLAAQCYDYAANNLKGRQVFVFITDLGAGRPLWVIGIASVVALLIRREWFIAVVWALGQYYTQNIVGLLKDQFKRPRPPFVEMEGTSFPSGHSLGSAIIYGMLAYLVLRYWAGSRWRWVLAGLLYLFIVLVGVSRMVLSAHYLSDVVAGTCFGLGWAALCAFLAECFKPSAAGTSETKTVPNP